MNKPKKCMVCGKENPAGGDICPQCKDKIRREAMGEQAREKLSAEREFKKHGVTPPSPGVKSEK